MSEKWVISDLHLGHANILKYAGNLRGGTTAEEHDQWIIDQWNSVVKKCDLVYVLGDAAMNLDAYKLFKKMKGQKCLVRGNHDVNNARHLLDYFTDVCGLIRFKGTFWMSHAPIHPGSLRGLYNLCGHTHQNSVKKEDGTLDERYINCCVEMSYGVPQSLDDLLAKYKPLVEAARKENETN
jgi:calcineurin-like phosphoesterase family protein